MPNAIEYRYEIDESADVEFAVLQHDIEQAWAEIKNPGSELNRLAEQRQCVLFDGVSENEELEVSKSSAGLDHSAIELVITFLSGGVGTAILSNTGKAIRVVAKDSWEKVILPYLESKYGRGVIRESYHHEQKNKKD